MDQTHFYRTTTSRSFAETVTRVQEKACLFDFGVLHVHDVGKVRGDKGFKVEPTAIVELCDPKAASEALALDDRAALIMPCKIVVQQKESEVFVSTLYPDGLGENEKLRVLSEAIATRLRSLVDSAASVPSCCRI